MGSHFGFNGSGCTYLGDHDLRLDVMTQWGPGRCDRISMAIILCYS